MRASNAYSLSRTPLQAPSPIATLVSNSIPGKISQTKEEIHELLLLIRSIAILLPTKQLLQGINTELFIHPEQHIRPGSKRRKMG